jgi:hypothetical protein
MDGRGPFGVDQPVDHVHNFMVGEDAEFDPGPVAVGIGQHGFIGGKPTMADHNRDEDDGQGFFQGAFC